MKRKKNETDEEFSITDHDHHTGRLRGRLCNNCNSAYGFLGDSSARVAGLLRYARKYERLIQEAEALEAEIQPDLFVK